MKTPTEVVETIEAQIRMVKSHAHCLSELAGDMTALSIVVFKDTNNGNTGDADIAIMNMRRTVENMAIEVRNIDVCFRIRNALSLAVDQFTDADYNCEGENDD